jgi:hypothetical protein
MEDGTFTLLDARWIAPGSNPPEEEPKANGTVPGWLALLSPTETSGKCSVEGRKADIIPGASMEHIWASIDIESTKCVNYIRIALNEFLFQSYLVLHSDAWPGFPNHPSVGGNNDHFHASFEGTLQVPKPGTYSFRLDSDDGSRLFIDGEEVCELRKSQDKCMAHIYRYSSYRCLIMTGVME